MQTMTPARMPAFLLLLAVLSAPPALAQQAPGIGETVLPPPTGDEPIPPPTPMPSLPVLNAAPNAGPFMPPPASPPTTLEEGWAQLFDPVRTWFSQTTFFFDKEIDIMKPHLKAALTGPAIFPGGGQTTVQPPTASLNWTGAARVEVGWFLPPSLGYFAFTYRGFADDGRQTVTALDGIPYALRSRLDLNQIAFDYGTAPYSFAPRYFVSGRIGMAAANVFFDNVAVSSPQTQDASNDFYGAGPHVRLDMWREFNLLPGLALFAQPDLMVLVGRVQQHYRESNTFAGSTVAGSYFLRRTQTVPVFTLRTGLSYTPPQWPRLRFMVGYEFEDWWDVGRVPDMPSRGQFYSNGVFLRAVATY